MRSGPAAIGTGALVTALAAILVWALTGAPPAAIVAPGGAVAGAGWELSGAVLTTSETGAEREAPQGASHVVVRFVLAAHDPISPGQLGCSVEFRAGRLSWRPDNAALPLDGGSSCAGLQPGPNQLAYSVTVPSGVAGDVVAEVTVAPRGEPGELRWFRGEAVLRVSR